MGGVWLEERVVDDGGERLPVLESVFCEAGRVEGAIVEIKIGGADGLRGGAFW